MKQMIVKKQNDSVRESNKTKNFDKIWKTLQLLYYCCPLCRYLPEDGAEDFPKMPGGMTLETEIITSPHGSGWTETVTGLQNAIALTITVGWLKIPLLQTAIP